MQIKMKQAEITAALKQYIGGQGINLAGKSFEVEYTAGRKEAGLLADISIEIIEGAEPEAAAATAPVAEAEKKSPDVAVAIDAGAGAGATAAVAVPAAVAKPSFLAGLKENADARAEQRNDEAESLSDRPIGEIPVSTPPVKTTSLFGKPATV